MSEVRPGPLVLISGKAGLPHTCLGPGARNNSPVSKAPGSLPLAPRHPAPPQGAWRLKASCVQVTKQFKFYFCFTIGHRRVPPQRRQNFVSARGCLNTRAPSRAAGEGGGEPVVLTTGVKRVPPLEVAFHDGDPVSPPHHPHFLKHSVLAR